MEDSGPELVTVSRVLWVVSLREQQARTIMYAGYFMRNFGLSELRDWLGCAQIEEQVKKPKKKHVKNAKFHPKRSFQDPFFDFAQFCVFAIPLKDIADVYTTYIASRSTRPRQGQGDITCAEAETMPFTDT